MQHEIAVLIIIGLTAGLVTYVPFALTLFWLKCRQKCKQEQQRAREEFTRQAAARVRGEWQ